MIDINSQRLPKVLYDTRVLVSLFINLHGLFNTKAVHVRKHTIYLIVLEIKGFIPLSRECNNETLVWTCLLWYCRSACHPLCHWDSPHDTREINNMSNIIKIFLIFYGITFLGKQGIPCFLGIHTINIWLENVWCYDHIYDYLLFPSKGYSNVIVIGNL